MAVRPSQTLDYATPAANPRARFSSLEVCGGAVLIAIVLGITDIKINPGGPFISIHAELIPAVLCVCALAAGVRVIVSGTVKRRLLAVIFMLLAAVQVWATVACVLSFWFGRYSRGSLFGL